MLISRRLGQTRRDDQRNDEGKHERGNARLHGDDRGRMGAREVADDEVRHQDTKDEPAEQRHGHGREGRQG